MLFEHLRFVSREMNNATALGLRPEQYALKKWLNLHPLAALQLGRLKEVFLKYHEPVLTVYNRSR